MPFLNLDLTAYFASLTHMKYTTEPEDSTEASSEPPVKVDVAALRSVQRSYPHSPLALMIEARLNLSVD